MCVSPSLLRRNVHPRDVLCSPKRLISYAWAIATVNLSLRLANGATTVNFSIHTAMSVISMPLF